MLLSKMQAKVLIVDDDADIRNAVCMTLAQSSGVSYSFAEADSVATGLEAVKRLKPDVIILDIHMPGEDGFDFMKRLKRSKFQSGNVIVLTADDSLRNLWQAESEGVNAYRFMGKPFRTEELQALVLGLIMPRQAT
jgi:two-component system, LytTR family, response regulator